MDKNGNTEVLANGHVANGHVANGHVANGHVANGTADLRERKLA